MQTFLEGVTSRQLRLPLQLTLGVSPLYLLNIFPLREWVKCDRQALLQVSHPAVPYSTILLTPNQAMDALGNIRPSLLVEFEKKFFATLVHIALNPTDLHAELSRLVSSDLWQKSENLPSSDPAFRFFDRRFQ